MHARGTRVVGARLADVELSEPSVDVRLLLEEEPRAGLGIALELAGRTLQHKTDHVALVGENFKTTQISVDRHNLSMHTRGKEEHHD